MAKQIIEVKPRNKISLNDIETSMRKARNSCDYILIKFGRRGEFIRIDFAKDQTYGVSHNLYNMEFSVRLGIIQKQLRVVNILKLSAFLFDWVTRLNK